jgi:hypothetical protein
VAGIGAAAEVGRDVSDAVLREVWHGRIWRANACRIVEETAERVALWFPRGAASWYPVRPHGSELRIPAGEWTLAKRHNPRDALALYRPDARHSIWHFRNDDGALDFWYVNFEQPLHRIPAGFDFHDEKLDLIVEPDGTWRWKDEDELEEAAQLGLVDADEVRAEAARVLADPPWPTGWEDWQPDPGWRLPELPAGWDAA